MRKPAIRIHILLGVALVLLAGVAWALVSGIEVISPGKVGSNTSEQIEVTVKNGDNPVPDAKILVTTDYGWLQRGETFPDKAKIGQLKLLEDQSPNTNKVKRAIYTADDEGRVTFVFYGDPADVGEEATVIIRELDGTFQTSFRIRIGLSQLVRGDPLPVCSLILFDKQADAGGDAANHPVFVFWVGFEDSSGNLINVDDAKATAYCTLLTPEATLITESNMMFGKYVPIALENVPPGGASVYVELIGDNGVAAAGTINTGDTPGSQREQHLTVAKLTFTLWLCLVAAAASASGLTCNLSVGENSPQNGESNVHLTLQVPQDENQPVETYGVLMYYKGPWRLHRSGDRWSPQRIAGGKAFLVPPDQAWGFYDVTLPCFVCTGGIPGEPEQPPQPTPYIHEINLSVPFQNYAWSDGAVTAEVWRSVPPENPMIPGYLTCVYRKTIKVQPSHEHAIVKTPGPLTAWVTNQDVEDFKLSVKILAISKYAFEVIDTSMLEGMFCKKIADRLMRLVAKNAQDWLPAVGLGYMFISLDFDWETRLWTKEYSLICCHNDEPDWKEMWDTAGDPYWAPDTWDFDASLRRDRLHITAEVAQHAVGSEYIDFGYTEETTTNGRILRGDHWGYCFMAHLIPDIPTRPLPTEWWTSDERNYQYIGPLKDGHTWPCGHNPVHNNIYTYDPAGFAPFPPPELIQ